MRCLDCQKKWDKDYDARRAKTAPVVVVCGKCGLLKERASLRGTSCRACANAYALAWRNSRPEAVAAIHARAREKQKLDPVRKADRTAKARAKYRENPEPLRTKSHNRRALVAGLGGTLTVQEWASILECFDHRCAYCLRKMVRLEKDHVVALIRGGSSDASNIVPACRACNSRKHGHPVWHTLRWAA